MFVNAVRVSPSSGRAPTSSKKDLVARWGQERAAPSRQFIGVLRHTERFDSAFATLDGGYWLGSRESKEFPYDPPLSDNGVSHATQIGQNVRRATNEFDVVVHSVATSPYLRCVQTALEVCCQLGPDTNLIVDCSLGELYGPHCMGTTEPKKAPLIRDIRHIVQLCRSRGITCEPQYVGQWPTWPEDLQSARRRFAKCFLKYLRRSVRVRRNFLIVSHADCVGSALSMMPSQGVAIVEKIEFGGMLLAHRLLRPEQGTGSGPSEPAQPGAWELQCHGIVQAVVDDMPDTSIKSLLSA